MNLDFLSKIDFITK